MRSLMLLSGILAVITFSMSVNSCDKDFFGRGCKFKCHCRAKDGDQSTTRCNVNGDCLSGAGCEPGWFGPACQYVDMANDSAVVTRADGTNVTELTDGDDQSCLPTSRIRVIHLTWTEPFVFRWLRVHVSEASVVHGFTVRFRSNNSQQFPIACSNPRNATVSPVSLDIYCDVDVPIRSIKLAGPGVKALCSIYVSGGRNIALLGNATQSSSYYYRGQAKQAVDGNRNSDYNSGSCSHTDVDEKFATWNISFSQPQLINRLLIFNRDNEQARLRGFVLTASSSENKNFSYQDKTGVPQNVYDLAFSANNTAISQVGIQAMNPYKSYNYYILTLCEVEIYGDTVCQEGMFGRECEFTCNCSGPCFVSTGGCPFGCRAGYHGEGCRSGCSQGSFGPNCAVSCSPHCGAGGYCRATDGKCVYGCQAGYINPTCNDTCGYQLFGLECSRNCSFMCVNDGGRLCEPISGKCLAGCRSDYNGSDCQVVPAAGSHQESSLAGPAIGAAAAVFLLAVAAVAVFICWRRRRYSKSTGRRMDASNENMVNSSDDVMLDELPKTKMSQVGNSGNTPGLPHSTMGDYYNFTPASNRDSNTRIPVKQLDIFMGTHDHSFFQQQFASIPANQDATMVVGQSSENKNKNRYKNICAYDHSRVHLQGGKHKKHGDYINASYVEGYKEDELFIASQGPTKAILGDFVQMLWEQEVEKVVMLTNLVEEGKHKCERYWPEDGEIKLGEVTVKLATTQVFADYTIRLLQLSTKGGQVQTVTHFHFTSWPDKDVPTAPWGLVDFEQRVASYPTRKPIVVHCSAGVGRTGTFIALRNVMRQAEDMGYVDVFTTVTMLRRSRVNMVQTAEQYEFLHRSAQVAILCMGTTVTSSGVRDRIHQLSLTGDTGITNMEIEFQAVSTICNLDDKQADNNETSPDDPHMVYQNSLAVANLPKNRFSNILPKEYYRVILSATGEAGSYINAVFVPSFTKQNQHILTQLPLPGTVTDLWRLVIQYKVTLIVAFEAGLGLTDKTVGTYLPQAENDAISFNQFNIKTEQVISEKFWQKQEVVITGPTRRSIRKSAVRIDRDMYVTHLQCTSRDLEPGNLLSVVKQVRSLAQAGKDKILYMCRNGADYCGLACILSLLLDRMDSDQRLTIPLVVGAVKAIRPQVIPTLTQYRLLYDVLSMYVDSVNVYSNF